MRLLKARAAIVNATPFCASGGRYYLAPSELVSLAQWFPLFEQTILLKPELRSSSPPSGWMSLPSDIEVVSLCSHADSHSQRKTRTREASRRALEGVDLLYARMPNYEGYWVFEIARQMGIPLLLELHGCWMSSIWEEDCQSISRRITRWGRAWLADRSIKQMARYATAIVTIGPDLKRRYARPDTPTLVSTNHLVREMTYSPRTEFDLRHPPTILFVGDIQRRKGLHVLFGALKNLKAMGRSFRMVLVGDGEMKGELRSYARRENLSDNVVFTGRLPHGPDLLEWFKKADVFVLPSIAAEGVPRATHEAMALGCPVIATNIGSIAWQLDGGAGIVIPPNDAQALAGAICDVFENSGLRRQLSGTGYQRSLDYTLEKQQASLAEFVFTHITGKNAGQG